jgi:DNA segregation ATPase FtsK/SpoIIIE-like protein
MIYVSNMTEEEFRELEPMYEQAKTEIPLMPSITISSVQRQYRFGYNRAAHMLERLAQYGVLNYDRRTGAYSRATVGGEHAEKV